MKEPLVSIITPSYNQGQFVEDCILSIRNQIYQNFEHIIIDGGSSDNTREILKKYEGTYNMRWISKPDDGMYDAINKGFKMSKGDILAYLNCDDFYLPWSISVAVKNLNTHDIIFGDSIICSENMTDAYLHFTPPFIKTYYYSVGVIVQPTVFFRRELFEKVGSFDHQAFKLIADYDYWLRCAFAGYKPKKIYEFLAIQRDHEITQRSTRKELIKQEFIHLRFRYSENSWFKIKTNRIFMHMYWRFALLTYKIAWLPFWHEIKSSKIVNLSWARYLLEITPMSIRKYLVSNSYCDLESIYNLKVK